MSLLVTNGRVFTLGAANELIPDGAVYIEGDTIAEVGTTAELLARHPHAERLNVGGKVVLPGMPCGHTHFYGVFSRGMAIPGAPATNFVEILEKLWWNLDMALLWEDVKYSALICLVDAVKHGCTTLIDHHASPNAIDGSLDVIAEAVKEAGLRASLCYEVTDRNGMDGAAAGIAENVRWLKRCRAEKDPQLAGSFGLHAALTLSDETLDNSVAAAQGLDTGFHIHVAEDQADQDHSLRKYNMRVVERLHNHGILGPQIDRRPLRAPRRVREGHPARDAHARDAPAALEHEQRGRTAGRHRHAGKRHPGRARQRRVLELHGRRDEGHLPGAQAQHARSAHDAGRRGAGHAVREQRGPGAGLLPQPLGEITPGAPTWSCGTTTRPRPFRRATCRGTSCSAWMPRS